MSFNSFSAVLLLGLVVYGTQKWLHDLRPRLDAEKAFKKLHGGEYIAWSAVQAHEAEHWIVAVHYGHSEPPLCECYSVSKRSHLAQRCENNA